MVTLCVKATRNGRSNKPNQKGEEDFFGTHSVGRNKWISASLSASYAEMSNIPTRLLQQTSRNLWAKDPRVCCPNKTGKADNGEKGKILPDYPLL